MSPAAPAIQEASAKLQVLQTEARALAQAQGQVERAAAIAWLLPQASPVSALESARKHFVSHPSQDATIKKAAEWFLDNHYLIRRVARQVSDELPQGFARRLPQLAAGPDKGAFRIRVLASAFVQATNLDFDLRTLRAFVDAYQEATPLTIAELWALPTLLRSSVLQHLLGFVADLQPPAGERRTTSYASRSALHITRGGPAFDPTTGISHSVRALRVLAEIDWKAFFEKTNRVEAVLQQDPAKVYAGMDFHTCDLYRKAVEELAWNTGVAEEEVATQAIKLAAEQTDARIGHVGHYLLADGRRVLETRLGYRAHGITRLRRALRTSPTLSYLLPPALFTGLGLLALGAGLVDQGASALWVALTLCLAAIPISGVAVAILHRVLAQLLPPARLPKLDFSRGLPKECRTLVVIPTLLSHGDDVAQMLSQIELHYLANPDPELRFALLTDYADSPTPHTDDVLLEGAASGIALLNERHGTAGQRPFHLLHRAARWNAAEGQFMGWERKRGKLEELNCLLRGKKDTSYVRHVGEAAGLEGIRYVITLDSDTQLPMGSAQRLVGLLAHPLNQAVFDEKTGRVVSGYTIVQPRVETSPSSARETLFSRVFAGDIGFDIYTHAVSDTHQDLLGAGIYVGKGIYDVDAFMRSTSERVPDNTLLSHDLFEGIHGRAALASDTVLFEDYPAHYATYTKRMHRWVRGDWQLLPWLWPKVPTATGRWHHNTLSLIDRWKIADNLRRSLAQPLRLAWLLAIWCYLPGDPALMTVIALATLLLPALPPLAGNRIATDGLARCALSVVFMAHESCVALDAIVRVLVRTTITRKHLLQWTSAAHTAIAVKARSPRAVLWRMMSPSVLLSLALGALVAHVRPSALLVAAPLLVLFCLAPELASRLSLPVKVRTERLGDAQRKKLRLLALRTWRFFDTFVGPGDQWLPIDNYQEPPREQIAHRTSPTNIGLMLISSMSAYDFGYIGVGELCLRLRRAFESIARLEHYQGHLLNWYDTKSLQPLLPRYVSTVDSGNFAGCLVALKQGCKTIANAAVLRGPIWEGLADSLDLLEEAIASAPSAASARLRGQFVEIRADFARAQREPNAAYLVLRELCDERCKDLDRELLALLDAGFFRYELDQLRALRTSTERFRHQLQQARRELDTLLPWLGLGAEAAELGITLPVELSLDQVSETAQRLQAELGHQLQLRKQRAALDPELEAAGKRLEAAFSLADKNASAARTELLELATLADDEVQRMDFRLLFDEERKLFYIGYNATVDQVDQHHYDLLASEARLASYLAIVKREVRPAHWFALGRPLAMIAGAPALLSWGGTMFEYLMPGLLMKSQPGTLLEQTCARVVDAQIAFGERHHEPWGISESSYARLDAHQTYQYRSFGVPGLGFDRAVEDTHVVAPYASLLALSIRPRAVVQNIEALESVGMLGGYGLFESLDLNPKRAPEGQSFSLVRSYMAHHQGMLLVALDNALHDQIMVERFHADPVVQTGEPLLNERAPALAPAEWPRSQSREHVADAVDVSHLPTAAAPWSVDTTQTPQAFVLGNGSLSSVVTQAGGGQLLWQGLALTRYQPDATCDRDGFTTYLRDEESGRVWRATASDGRTTYAAHQASYHRREDGISVHVDVAVAAADDVEMRQITLHNETDRARRLSVTGAARPVLIAVGQAATHPAFSSMFVESERLSDLDALLFARRSNGSNDAPAVLVHRLVREGAATRAAGFETDRAAFYGRGASLDTPRALCNARGPLRGHAGMMLDPLMSLMAEVTLEPNQSVTLAFVTTVGRSRSAAVKLAQRYGSMHAVRWAFRDAEHQSLRYLQRIHVDPSTLQVTQKLFSALLFVDTALRASSQTISAARPCQSRLWGRGISGDDPIIFLRVHDVQAPILREVLAAQRFLRTHAMKTDLVLLDEAATGYGGSAGPSLRSVLDAEGASAWLDRHGGIYLLAGDQVAGDEIRHVEATARVLLDTRDGSLAARFDRAIDHTPRLPLFESTLTEQTAPVALGAPERLFDNGLGGFSEDGREYVIRLRPGETTPAPWCNVLANPELGCLTSESSLGSTWSLNSGENRLTPWRNDAVFDTPSEAFYIRDEETASFWSATPAPAGRDVETRVSHGAGYTRYETHHHGLEQTLTVFVPADAPLKVLRLRVKNTLTRHRRLTMTYYAEWVLGSRAEPQRVYVSPELDAAHACLLASCAWNAEFGERVAFMASERELHGFTTSRTEFLGRNGDYARPEGLLRWGLSGNASASSDPCAALQIHVELAPGEELQTHFVLGQAANRADALAVVARYRDAKLVDTAQRDMTAFWDAQLGTLRVKTPEPAMDLMLNRWLLYQTLSARVFGRTAFYQSSGAFGFRDQLQDVMALLHASPALARAHILESAAHQFEAGDVLHWWHPPSGRGVRTRCSDDMAWLPFVTAEYIAATGDTKILDEVVPFLKGEPLRFDEHDRYAQYAVADVSASLREHCRRALETALTRGAHGLPLMRDGDWNDGMNRIGSEGRGESVWLGWFLCATMRRFAELLERVGDQEESARWHGRAQTLRASIEAAAWDGAWYLRAFHDDGSLVGSSANRECSIDSIAQSWAVLAGDLDANRERRARGALASCEQQLVRESDKLVLLFAPPYDSTAHDPGYVRAYPPGVRENGGQYTHAAAWLGWAYTMLGEGASAERIFRLLNPISRTQTSAEVARYRVEPYVLAGDIYGCAPWGGRGGWTWYTGSAAWVWRLGVEAILGLRRVAGELQIDPCIPASWPGFEAWVRVGEQEVHVVVENPDAVSTGVAALTLDGARLTTRQLHLDPKATGTRELRVRLGAGVNQPAARAPSKVA